MLQGVLPIDNLDDEGWVGRCVVDGTFVFPERGVLSPVIKIDKEGVDALCVGAK